MKRLRILSLVAPLAVAQAGDERPQVKPGVGDLQVLEGELRAASTLFGETKTIEPRDFQADTQSLTRGLPGGILTSKGFTMLLVDGRVLAKLRDVQRPGENAVRVYGILHDEGRSLTPFRIEYRDDRQWITFDLPTSGTLAPGVLGGDD
jgi:hypothetical protein